MSSPPLCSFPHFIKRDLWFSSMFLLHVAFNQSLKIFGFFGQVFRTDFITAMKIPDNQTLPAGRHYELVDAWRQEWERGVQVRYDLEDFI